MIIIGYPGIGKSTICGADRGIIDLESSYFHPADAGDWAVGYSRVAWDLHKQGFDVCTSSHPCVIDELTLRKMPGDPIAIIYPAKVLKEQWIEKLKKRYEISLECADFRWIIEKNRRAYERALDHYDEDIFSLSMLPLRRGELCDMQ